EHIFDQEGHTAEGAVAQQFLVEAVDAVGIELDHGPDGGIDLLLGGNRGFGQLLWAHLLFGDELGQSEGVVAGVFGEIHRALLCNPSSFLDIVTRRWRRRRTGRCARERPRTAPACTRAWGRRTPPPPCPARRRCPSA